jgi:hypothetical protein
MRVGVVYMMGITPMIIRRDFANVIKKDIIWSLATQETEIRRI